MKNISTYIFEKPVSCGEFCEFLSEVLKISPESYLTFTPDIQYYDVQEDFGIVSLRGPFVQLYFNEEIYSSGPMFLSSLYAALIQNYKPSDILDPYYKPVRAKARNLPTPVLNIIEP
jgi:hypothetical protein